METVHVFSQDTPDTIMPHECNPCTQSWERECYTQCTNDHTFPSILSTSAHQDIHLNEGPKRQEAHPVTPSEKGMQRKEKIKLTHRVFIRLALSFATTSMPGSAWIGVGPSLVLASPLATSILISILISMGTGKNWSRSLGTGGGREVGRTWLDLKVTL